MSGCYRRGGHRIETGMAVCEISPAVAVLMATYNGSACIQAQLDSLAAQSHRPALILISDDGSSDDTIAILHRFARAHPDIEVRILEGPRLGAAQNFLFLLRQVPSWIDMVALSDQDDIWLPKKIERGVHHLEQAGGKTPVLYCGRTWEWYPEDDTRRHSSLPKKAPSFRHALVQNIAGGNTMMLNRAGADLACAASLEARRVVVHDWWLYQIVTGTGGTVIYDREPMMLYRQHSENLIGANRGLAAKVWRVRHMLSGRFRRWGTINIRALRASEHRLSDENRALLDEFARDRNGPAFKRVRMVWRAGLYRQGPYGQLSLYAAAFLGRL